MSHFDGILMHRAVEAELSHRLAYVGSTRTDVHGWKADNTAKEARSDSELHLYNATDCVVVARLIEGLRDDVRARQMSGIVGKDHKIQSFCRDMHITGMLVDQKRRAFYDERYKREALKFRAECRELAGEPGMNPNSVAQIADLLFERWRLPVTEYSEKTGDPSTDDDTLLNLMFRTPGVNPKQKQFCDAVRKFRHAAKFRGTYVTKLRRMDEEYPEDDDLLLDEEEEEARRELRLKRALKRGRFLQRMKRGIVHCDGRLRADYNAHGTTSRRLSSSNPNMQNFPRVIRDMLIPAPGHVFVYADMDQLELRAMTNLAKCVRYIQAFLEGRDPHTETVLTMLADEGKELLKQAKAWASTPAAEGQSYKKHEFFSRARDFAKKFSYACLARGTKVATLDASGWKSIEDIEPGDWTYCWNGERYEPTKVLKAQCMGTKPVFRLRCFDGVGRRKEIVATGDHLFLLRDGTYRRLDALHPGDRLMPFRRALAVGGKYRQVDSTNTGRKEYEHRKHPSKPATVEMLEARSRKMKEHWATEHDVYNARLTAGRVRSEKWREAVRHTAASARAIRLQRRHEQNHKVEAVDPCGVSEVWDITVDHPSHNFAIYDGVFVHNCIYAAKAPTVHGIIVSTTDDHGNLLYPNLTLEEARDRRSNWLGGNPEIEGWWDQTVLDYRRDGYLIEPVDGWRRDFLDGEDLNELVNFRPQSLGAALVHSATIELCYGEDAPLRRGRWGKDTGLVQQGHDAVVFELPEAKAKWAVGLVTEAMTRRVPGHLVPYTAEAKVYVNFRDELKKAA